MKTFVDVICIHYKSGKVKPLVIVWEDGRKYQIDKISDVRNAASLKSGGVGLRYRCRIGNYWRYLFLEGEKWFIEKC